MSSKSKSGESPRLVIIEGPEKGRVVPLRSGTVVIGRSKGDVVIQDPRISRSHVAIHVDDRTSKVTFTDLKSLNGVLLNGKGLETGELRDGDRLQLGNTTFDCQTRVQEDSQTEPAIHLKKRRKDPERSENTDISEVAFLGELRPEPTGFGDAIAEPPPAPTQSGLKGMLRNMTPRSRMYAGLVVVLLFILVMMPSGKKSGGKDADRDYASIRQLEAEGKLTEAATQAEKIKATEPNNPTVHRLLGDLYFKQQHTEQSIEAYKRSLDLNAAQIELLPKLARLYLTTGNIAAAQAINSEIDLRVEKGPQTKDFFIGVANLYLDFPKLELRPEKMVIIGQALQNKFAPDDPSGYKLEALGHMEQGQSEDAIKILEKAKGNFPQDESFYLYLVLGKVHLKDFESANTMVQQWISLFPRSLQPLVLMGQLKYQLKEYDDSMKYLQKAVKLGTDNPRDTNYPKALFLMGELYYQQSQVAEAENALRQSCELGFSDGCEHVLIKGPLPSGDGRSPQSLKKKK